MKSIVTASAVLLLLTSGLIFLQQQEKDTDNSTMVVYKRSTCGCCVKWVEHMEKAGFDVEAHDVNNLAEIKTEHGIARPLSSCHTALVGGYVVEGHVPAQYVLQMLEEKPDIKGIAVPAMPIGSPGMEGPNAEPYNVLAFDGKGHTVVYAQVVP